MMFNVPTKRKMWDPASQGDNSHFFFQIVFSFCQPYFCINKILQNTFFNAVICIGYLNGEEFYWYLQARYMPLAGRFRDTSQCSSEL